MGNNALTKNPPNASIDINTHTSDWLWAVFAVMLLSFLIMTMWKFTRPRAGRVFHYMGMAVLFIATIAYFSMASDLGDTPVAVEFAHGNTGGGTRAIWFARYIMWILATPLLMLLVFLGAATSIGETFALLFFDIAFFVLLLLGALTPSSYKWGYFVFALFALFYLWFHKWSLGRMSSTGAGTGGVYTRGATWLTFCFILIPICWGLSEGGNRISPTGEMVFYGIIDIFMMPIFLFTHIGMLGNSAYGPYTGAGATGPAQMRAV